MNDIPSILRRGADAAFGKNKNHRIADASADALMAADAAPLGSLALTNMVETLYENGWQPLDLVHAVRRQQTSAVSNLAAAVLLHQADLTNADSRAPQDWVDQISSICELFPKIATRVEATPDFLTAYLKASGKSDYIAASDQWLDVLALLGQWQSLPRWPQLGPKPSGWPRKRTTVRGVAGADAPNAKILGRIRGLLAKADATDFDEEAETLTAKAQELMTRYSIDSAVLDARAHHDARGLVVTRRLTISSPYPDAKSALLHAVARNNNARSVFHKHVGLVSIVGLPVDLEMCELLYTSLLVQSIRALDEAGRDPGHRSAGFRRSFLLSFAARIGERLADMKNQASHDAEQEYGHGVVAVLARRSEAVDTTFRKLFPDVRRSKTTISNADGWRQGRSAAERADLSGGPKRIRR